MSKSSTASSSSSSSSAAAASSLSPNAVKLGRIEPFKIASRILSVRFPLFEDGFDYPAAERLADKKVKAIISASTSGASKKDSKFASDAVDESCDVITADTEFYSLSSKEQVNYMEHLFFRGMSRHCLKKWSLAIRDYDALIESVLWKELKSKSPLAEFYYSFLLRAKCALQAELALKQHQHSRMTSSSSSSLSSSDITTQMINYHNAAVADLKEFIDRIQAVDDTNAEHTRSGAGKKERKYKDRGMIGTKMVNLCDYEEAAYLCEVVDDWIAAEELWSKCLEWDDIDTSEDHIHIRSVTTGAGAGGSGSGEYQLRHARACVSILLNPAKYKTNPVRAAALTEQLMNDCRGRENSKEALILLAYAYFCDQKPRDAKRALDTLQKRLGSEMNDAERKEANELRKEVEADLKDYEQKEKQAEMEAAAKRSATAVGLNRSALPLTRNGFTEAKTHTPTLRTPAPPASTTAMSRSYTPVSTPVSVSVSTARSGSSAGAVKPALAPKSAAPAIIHQHSISPVTTLPRPVSSPSAPLSSTIPRAAVPIAAVATVSDRKRVRRIESDDEADDDATTIADDVTTIPDSQLSTYTAATGSSNNKRVRLSQSSIATTQSSVSTSKSGSGSATIASLSSSVSVAPALSVEEALKRREAENAALAAELARVKSELEQSKAKAAAAAISTGSKKSNSTAFDDDPDFDAAFDGTGSRDRAAEDCKTASDLLPVNVLSPVPVHPMTAEDLVELKARLAPFTIRYDKSEWKSQLAIVEKTESQLATEFATTDAFIRLHVLYRQNPFFENNATAINNLFDSTGNCRGDTFAYYCNRLLTPVNELVVDRQYRPVLRLAFVGIDGLIDLTLEYLAGPHLPEADIKPILESLMMLAPYEFDEYYHSYTVDRLLLPHAVRVEQMVIGFKSKFEQMSKLCNRSATMIADLERSEKVMTGFFNESFGSSAGARLIRSLSSSTPASLSMTQAAAPVTTPATGTNGTSSGSDLFEVHPSILNNKLWCIRKPQSPPRCPPELATFCHAFESGWHKSTFRTRLTWLWDRGSAELAVSFPSPVTATTAPPIDRTLVVTVPQMLILLVFNRIRRPDMTQLLEETQFAHDAISPPLIGLLIAGVLKKDPPQHTLEYSDRFSLNPAFPANNKRKKTVIKESNLNRTIAIPHSHVFRTDEALIRSLKRSRTRLDADLVKDVLQTLKPLFSPYKYDLSFQFVLNRVTKLIDMEYFRYDSVRKHLLHYVA